MKLTTFKVTSDGLLHECDVTRFGTICATLQKVALLNGCFLSFLNYANGTKSRNPSQIYLMERFFETP